MTVSDQAHKRLPVPRRSQRDAPTWYATDGVHACYVKARSEEDALRLAAALARFRDIAKIIVSRVGV